MKSLKTREKMRQAKLKNPTRYWKGKNLPKDMIEKIRKTKIDSRVVHTDDYKKSMSESCKSKGVGKWNKGKKRSDEVKEKMTIAMYKRWSEVPKKTKRYKHNRSKVYMDWHTQVLERDDYTCQDCGVRGVYLEVHHIKSYAHFPESRLDIDNGLTLCKPCHKLTSNYAGKNNKLCFVS